MINTYKDLEMLMEFQTKQMWDEIIDRLIAYRIRLEMTQQDIADASGISLLEIIKMESKKKTVSAENLKQYANSMGYDLRIVLEKAWKEEEKLSLPIGVSNYCEASTEYYYIDKTMLIKDVLDEKTKIALFTRPRRFGKTLNMDMLRTFFEKSEQDTSVYFKDKRIWQWGEKYTRHQGKYPVIFMTFKDVKFLNWEDTTSYLKAVFANEFQRHPELGDSEKCNMYEKEYYKAVASQNVSVVELSQALSQLSKMLYKHHGESVIIIIDEYDIPIQQGYMRGFYDEAVTFIRNLFSGAFKDNPYIKYGFMTGILRVAKESIFSGLNNLKVNSILDERYSTYFGFTQEEVREMVKYYGVSDKYTEICHWYDGYRFGRNDIFNPWSVMGYLNAECIPKAYWTATSSNDIIGAILKEASDDILEQLNRLLKGESVYTNIDTSVIYPHIKSNPASVYSFLLVSGYLKAVREIWVEDGESIYEVKIPNKEVIAVYKKEILSHMTDIISASVSMKIREAIYRNDSELLQKQLHKLLMQSISYNDASSESFYHGLMLGLCAMLDGKYFITSNRESGDGRFDIQLMPRTNSQKMGVACLPGILIELKAAKNCTMEELETLARQALEQIERRHYDTDMKMQDVKKVLKYGVAFCGKQVAIASTS